MSSVAESEGLGKLIAFLNQTKRQAEDAIDTLNQQIKEISQERDTFRDESVYYKRCSEQLQMENSKKWRLNERDDWKSLVESVQADRSRLQDEVARLQLQLDASYGEVSNLNKEIAFYRSALQQYEGDDTRQRHELPEASFVSTNVASSSNGRSDESASLKALQVEVEKLRAQNEIAYRSYQAELLAQHTEIMRLRERLPDLDYSQTPLPASSLEHSTTNGVHSSSGIRNHHDIASEKQASWGFFSFMFEDTARRPPSDEILRI